MKAKVSIFTPCWHIATWPGCMSFLYKMTPMAPPTTMTTTTTTTTTDLREKWFLKIPTSACCAVVCSNKLVAEIVLSQLCQQLSQVKRRYDECHGLWKDNRNLFRYCGISDVEEGTRGGFLSLLMLSRMQYPLQKFWRITSVALYPPLRRLS